MVVAVLMGILTAGGVRFVVPGMPLSWALVIGMCLTAFTMYGLDKAAARRQGVRIPEAVLHMVALLGGSPGALLGQWGFRHKTRKLQFQAITWLIVAVQVAALWLWRG